MKKLLFFKSSSSKGDENHEMSTTTRDKKHYVDTRWKTMVSENLEKKFQKSERFSPVSDRKASEKNTISKRSPILRRSRSLSMASGADENGRLSKEDMIELRNRNKFQSSSNVVSAPKCDCSDWDLKPARYNVPSIQIPSDEVLVDRDLPGSPKSSCGSISIPSQMLDVYIDGEHHQEMKFRIGDHHSTKATGSLKGRFQSHDHPSRGPLGPKNRHESPRKLAKDVVERLLRLEQVYDSKPKSMHGHSYLNVDDVNSEENLGSKKHSPSVRKQYREDDNDSVLRRKLEETKERAMLLSKELSQDCSFEYYSENLSGLTKSRNQLEEERKLVLEISDQLSCRIAERSAARETVSSVKEKMNSMVSKLEREKDELQSCFHRELNSREDDWDLKLQKLQSEECRLRECARELAEQNVSLQNEVSSFCTKEQEYNNRLSLMEADLNGIIAKRDQALSENKDLQEKLSEIQDKLKVIEETGSCMERNYKEKEKENTSLIKSVARLQEVCSQQERTIDGLRRSLQSSDEVGNLTRNLQMEQLRLTEVEQSLRRQLETCRVESESLRHENIYLLERLKSTGEVSGPSSLKLDQELESSVQCLSDTGLSLVNETIHTCGKLLGILESKTGGHNGFLETRCLMEYDMKIQGFKQGVQQLERSLGKAACVLKKKGEPENCDPDSYRGFQNTNRNTLEDYLKCELKAECLVTSIFKEKLYCKEREVEQVQAELARASRNLDVLKTEIQDAFDTVSCVNHKMKNLELQMVKKDGMMNQLEGELRSLREELSATKGVVSRITRERDLMWEEVKQHSEKNMLLDHEIKSLQKKIEGLEEDTLLKDGQISILKDSLNNAQPFGLDQRETFRL